MNCEIEEITSRGIVINTGNTKLDLCFSLNSNNDIQILFNNSNWAFMISGRKDKNGKNSIEKLISLLQENDFNEDILDLIELLSIQSLTYSSYNISKMVNSIYDCGEINEDIVMDQLIHVYRSMACKQTKWAFYDGINKLKNVLPKIKNKWKDNERIVEYIKRFDGFEAEYLAMQLTSEKSYYRNFLGVK